MNVCLQNTDNLEEITQNKTYNNNERELYD